MDDAAVYAVPCRTLRRGPNIGGYLGELRWADTWRISRTCVDGSVMLLPGHTVTLPVKVGQQTAMVLYSNEGDSVVRITKPGGRGWFGRRLPDEVGYLEAH